MDLYCKRCGEPWDFLGVTDCLDMTHSEKDSFLKGDGCPCCAGKPVEETPLRAQLAAVAQELLGDDLDGLAAVMDDAEFLMGEAFWE